MLLKNLAVLTPALVILSLVSGEAQTTSPFPDVPANHWAYSAMMDLHQKGIFVGYPKAYDNSTAEACWKSLIKAMDRGNEKVIRELMSEGVWQEYTSGKSVRVERLAYFRRVASFYREKERNGLVVWNPFKETGTDRVVTLDILLDDGGVGPTNLYFFEKGKSGWKLMRRIHD